MVETILYKISNMAVHFLFKVSTAKIVVIAVFITAAKVILGEEICKSPNCVFRELDRPTDIVVTSNLSTKLAIFCHQGQIKSLRNLWVNPHLEVEGVGKTMIPHDLAIYRGSNISDVIQQTSGLPYFSWNAFQLLKDEHQFLPFNYSCIGFTSTGRYNVRFRIKNPEMWYIAYVVLGFILFFGAPSLSRNSFFHYGTGMSFGVLASFLIVFFIVSRMLPQRLKTISYIVLVVSGSASMFMMQLVKNYLREIIQNHWNLVLGYIGASAILSFIVIYRIGSVTETRTLDLLRWSLQGLGLFVIYHGTQIPEASAAIILAILIMYLCPRTAPGWMKSIWCRLFPPKIRLLTEEEYNKEGEEETRKALEALQEYCHSPQCDPWHTIKKLSSPSRFANFVAGEPHLTDPEIEEHSMFVESLDFSDIEEDQPGGGDGIHTDNLRSFQSHHSQDLPQSADELIDSDSDYSSEPNNHYFHFPQAQ